MGARLVEPSRSAVLEISSENVLHIAEAGRTRLISIILVVLCVVMFFSTYLIGGDAVFASAYRITMVAGTLGGIAFSVLSQPNKFRPWYSVGIAFTCIVVLVPAYYYWGVLSFIVFACPFGAFIFGMNRSAFHAWLITAAIILAHSFITLTLAMGWVEDRSIMPLGSLGKGVVPAVLFVDVLIVAATVSGRFMLKMTRANLDELERATRRIGQRDALLLEARQELDRARGVRGPGRYTGQVLGRFELGDILGRGGMGEVYVGIERGSSEPVAVKVPHAHTLLDPAIMERFFREAEACRDLSAPNIVRVIDVAQADAPIPHIAMELVEGPTLSDILRLETRLSVSDTIDLVRQVGEGLRAAHARGIVHRDLKPGNLIAQTILGRRVWKILDFGLSKMVDTESTLTKGHVIGTPAYMAPEQASGTSVSKQTDIYSLGTIAYRALTGRPPYTQTDPAAVIRAVVLGSYVPPSEIISTLPPQMDYVIAVAMALHPKDRFETGEEFAAALALAAQGKLEPSLVELGRRILEHATRMAEPTISIRQSLTAAKS